MDRSVCWRALSGHRMENGLEEDTGGRRSRLSGEDQHGHRSLFIDSFTPEVLSSSSVPGLVLGAG